jgi:hypothetical protein
MPNLSIQPCSHNINSSSEQGCQPRMQPQSGGAGLCTVPSPNDSVAHLCPQEQDPSSLSYLTCKPTLEYLPTGENFA